MLAHYRFRRSSRAAIFSLLMASMLASCATADGPREVWIYAEETYGSVRDPGITATIDFQQRRFVADIHGAHYVGELLINPDGTRLKFQPRTAEGAVMDCSIGQLLRDLWRGSCTDSQHHVFELQVGHPLHV
jgi:hypothetical protein